MLVKVPAILTYDITAYSGDSLNCNFSWKNPDGTYVDFVGATALAQIKLQKTDTTAIDTFTVTLGNAANNITFSLSAAQVAALTIKQKYYYDIQITSGTNVRTYIVGTLRTTQDVTRV
jgi:hypothetical protein